MIKEEQKIIIGRLGRNPELSYTMKGVALCKLSLALEAKNEGKTIWKQVIAWDRLAEVIKVQLKKGDHIFVRGNEVFKEYQTPEGELKSVEEFIVERIALYLNQ